MRICFYVIKSKRLKLLLVDRHLDLTYLSLFRGCDGQLKIMIELTKIFELYREEKL